MSFDDELAMLINDDIASFAEQSFPPSLGASKH